MWLMDILIASKAWVRHSTETSNIYHLSKKETKRKTVQIFFHCDNFFFIVRTISISIWLLKRRRVCGFRIKKNFICSRAEGAGWSVRKNIEISVESSLHNWKNVIFFLFSLSLSDNHKFCTYFLINTSGCCSRIPRRHPPLALLPVIVWIPCSSCALFKYLDIHCLFSSLITHFIQATFIRITCSTSLERSTLLLARHKFYVLRSTSKKILDRERERKVANEKYTKTGFKDCRSQTSSERVESRHISHRMTIVDVLRKYVQS